MDNTEHSHRSQFDPPLTPAWLSAAAPAAESPAASVAAVAAVATAAESEAKMMTASMT